MIRIGRLFSARFLICTICLGHLCDISHPCSLFLLGRRHKMQDHLQDYMQDHLTRRMLWGLTTLPAQMLKSSRKELLSGLIKGTAHVKNVSRTLSNILQTNSFKFVYPRGSCALILYSLQSVLRSDLLEFPIQPFPDNFSGETDQFVFVSDFSIPSFSLAYLEKNHIW